MSAARHDGGRAVVAWLRSRFSRTHAWLAVAFWVGFSAWTFLIVSQGLNNAEQHPLTVIAATLATPLGPMTGAVSRGLQSCCLAASLRLMPYCLAGLAVAVALQLVLPPRGTWLRVLRLLAWSAGLLVWFGGGIASFLHALS